MNTTTNSPDYIIPCLLNYTALFTYYGLHKSTISKRVMLGKFVDIVKVGNRNYFKREDVEDWIDSHTVSISGTHS